MRPKGLKLSNNFMQARIGLHRPAQPASSKVLVEGGGATREKKIRRFTAKENNFPFGFYLNTKKKENSQQSLN